MSFVGDIVGGLIGADSAEDAANIQAGATTQAAQMQAAAQREATAEQRRQFDQTRTDMEPWRDAGTEAIGRLRNLLQRDGELIRRFRRSDFDSDPVEQIAGDFAMREANRAIDRRAPLSGGFDSGRTLRELTRFASDYGAQRAGASYARFNADQTQQFNRLASLSGIGQNATQAIGAAGMDAANNIGRAALISGGNIANLYASLGNAQGAASIARGNVLGRGVSAAGRELDDWWRRSSGPSFSGPSTAYRGFGGWDNLEWGSGGYE